MKIIHQIWFNLGHGEEIPPKYKKYQLSWKKNHPSWEYILWDEKMGDQFVKKYYPTHFYSYKNVKYGIMKIDILRYFILDKIGGLYADIDYKSIYPIDEYIDLNQDKDIMFNNASETNILLYKTNVSNSLIYCKYPNHPFWKIVIRELFERIDTEHFYKVYYVLHNTGPKLINDLLYKYKDKYKFGYFNSEQFNFCNSCGCKPSKTEKLYAVHDYVSYWNPDLWKFIRKHIFCNLKKILIFVCIILLIIVGLSIYFFRYSLA